MPESFDPYYTWLAIPPEEQPADHYRLLAIRRFESNEEVIINAADQRMAFIRTFQTGKRSKESQLLLNEIAAAQTCLLNPEKKLAYDEGLRRRSARPTEAPASGGSPSLSPAELIAAALRRHQSPPQEIGSHESPGPALESPPAELARPSWEIVTESASPDQAQNADSNSPDRAGATQYVALIGGGLLAGALALIVGLILWAATLPPPEPSASLETPRTHLPQPQPRESAENSAAVSPASASPTRAATETPTSATSSGSANSAPATAISAPLDVAASASEPQPGSATSPMATLPPDQDPIVARLGGGPRDRHPASHHLLLSANGDLFGRFTPAGKSCFWRISSGRGYIGGAVHGLALADDATAFAMLRTKDEIQILHFEDLLKPTTCYHSGQARAGAFSSDLSLFAAAIDDPEPLRIYDLKTGTVPTMKVRKTTLREIAWLGVHQDRLVCWSPEKKAEASLLRFDTARQRLDGTMDNPPLLLRTVSDVPSAYAIRQSGDALSIGCWNLRTGKLYAETPLAEISSPAEVLGLSRDAQLLAMRRGPDLALVRLPGNAEVCRIEIAGGALYAAALTTSDGVLVCSGPDADVCVINLPRLLAQPRWRTVRRGDKHVLEPVASDAVEADFASNPSTSD